MQHGEMQLFNTTPLSEIQPGEMKFGETLPFFFFFFFSNKKTKKKKKNGKKIGIEK